MEIKNQITLIEYKTTWAYGATIIDFYYNNSDSVSCRYHFGIEILNGNVIQEVIDYLNEKNFKISNLDIILNNFYE